MKLKARTRRCSALTSPCPSLRRPRADSTESFVDCDLRYPELHAELSTLKSTVAFLVDKQNADGSWGNWSARTDRAGDGRATSQGYTDGFSPSADAERSPRALTLLQWYLARVDASDARVRGAIDKFLDFILDPTTSAAFGVMQNNSPSRGGALVTGFVGLSLADIVQPFVTFGPL